MGKLLEKEVKRIAKKHNFSEETVQILLQSIIQGGGSQAQFNLNELGGMGQWQAGMIMIGDMFNNGLKNRVNDLCFELSELSRNLPVEKTEGKKSEKVKAETRQVTFKGSQNEMTYQYFDSENRLEILENGKMEAQYDTTGFELSGVQQQQDNSIKSIKFQDKNGKTLSLKDFKKV